ncbi:uncharacterized protein CEXT_446381 [Caerostris extrusa]|uniref:Uncharacterized protein n=1 Tax=Caerostris extrusa TaxID=172846 RepID=A0AAV4SA46_CAEEX|nr:uncharacterized protein CEXT_446381 [Caerostris extrusa]
MVQKATFDSLPMTDRAFVGRVGFESISTCCLRAVQKKFLAVDYAAALARKEKFLFLECDIKDYRCVVVDLRVLGPQHPLGLQRSEFEDFANAYRPTLDVPRREPEPPKPVEETKTDFGRSIKKLMKRPQGSPSVQAKNKKGGIQRTPTLAPTSSGHQERERSVTSDARPISDKKPKRPLSANIETTLLPPQQKTSVGPAMIPQADTNLAIPEVLPLPPQQSPILAAAPKLPNKPPKCLRAKPKIS